MANATPVIKHPGLYELHGDGIFLTYATAGVTGEPQLSYQDANLSTPFSGDEIRVVETEVGTLDAVMGRRS